MTHLQITKEEKIELLKVKRLKLPAALLKLIDAIIKDKVSDSEITIDETKESITPSDAANLLGVSRPFVMKLAKEGKLHTFLVGTHHRLKKSEVLAFKNILEGQSKKSFPKLNKGLNQLINDEGWDD